MFEPEDFTNAAIVAAAGTAPAAARNAGRAREHMLRLSR
jgi:uncharacterized protein YfiM (DUF2279 family)